MTCHVKIHCLSLLLLLLLLLWTETSYALSPKTTLTRRNVLQTSVSRILVGWTGLTTPFPALAVEGDDPRKAVSIIVQSSSDSLGLEIYDTRIGTPSRGVVAIRRVVETSRRNRSLQEGMIVKDFDSAQQVMEKLKHGPYPLKLDFVNLAAGGDAFNDLGGTIVTPKDALQLAEKTTTGDSSPSSSSNNSNNENHFSMTTIERPPKTQCAMESRRGDVLEINYEAVYVGRDGKKVTYDASIFRGTGLPYQLVLGSGDMIPGVDQGLYDMCPGETRELKIPPLLGYSSAGTQIFNIPPDYQRLEWKVELVSIDTTVRADNNVQSRQEREGRVL